MRCFFIVCEHFFGAIIESVRHLSFCKNRDFYGGDSEKKVVHFFLVRVKERKEIYILQKNLCICDFGSSSEE